MNVEASVAEATVSGYDLQLFEQLNEEYRERPLVPKPPALHSQGRMEYAERRLVAVSRDVGVEGKGVLEVGTAHGHMSSVLVNTGGAKSAFGVDVVASKQWAEFEGPSVSFAKADLARENPLEPESIDLVVSNAVLEHVDRPLAMIEAISSVLTYGGEAWLNFNLYRGPKASHRYREIFFPWPHLLFQSDVVEAFYREQIGRNARFAWVNHLTAAEYVVACTEAGLQVEAYRRSKTPIDIPFYRRFEERLGRYPALDLETDFLWLKLTKTREPPNPPPEMGYLRRQADFYAELDQSPAVPESREAS